MLRGFRYSFSHAVGVPREAPRANNLPVRHFSGLTMGDRHFSGAAWQSSAVAEPGSLSREASVDINTVVTSVGVRMPRLIYGTAWKEDRTAQLVVEAVRRGFRGIDTACQPKHYREDLVGDALVQLQGEGMRREDLFLQTKFTALKGQDPKRLPYDPNGIPSVKVTQSFAASQRNLKTNYVDSWVLHSPCETQQETLEVWRSMEVFFRNGGARQLGVSNFYDLSALQWLYEKAEIKPSVVQNRFYSDSGYDLQLREWCQERGIFYQSFWTLTGNPSVLRSSAVCRIARDRGRTAEQIFFRFVLDAGICPLTGTSSGAHMLQDLQVLLDPPLSEEEHSSVSALLFPQRGSGPDSCSFM
eukprot:TRINITY_DN68254_c0_g1_i1.p1 TRINITY_DN68254_c0_g1~~TRINITY_DN68254_c0_g1_i1.p1  ORF type:complete len:357 (+),score=43.58 TRINITY_DN68254_c0_g1_i1:113-1183(+)